MRTWSTTLLIQWESRRIRRANAVAKWGILPDVWSEVELETSKVVPSMDTLDGVIGDILGAYEER